VAVFAATVLASGIPIADANKPGVPSHESAAAAAARAEVGGFTVFLVGDSTMADRPLTPSSPERGWGQMLPLYFKESVRVENHASCGRSSKSFRDEGRWDVVLSRLEPRDYLVIGFGHNDQKSRDATRYTRPFAEFEDNLRAYVAEARSRGARPILATPIVRRVFDEKGDLVDTHGDYTRAIRELAAEEDVPVVDLNRRSERLVRKLGPKLSRRIYLWVQPVEYAPQLIVREDDSHFGAYGATRMCDLAVEEIQAKVPDLARWLR
jgi:lysophospholipase L1-like esterase